jgi:hypothetical protein
MKKETMLRGIGEIEDRFVEEAAPADEERAESSRVIPMRKTKRNLWIRLGSAAAACAVIALAAGVYITLNRAGSTAPELSGYSVQESAAPAADSAGDAQAEAAEGALSGETAGDSAAIGNPFTDYDSLAAAEQASGITVAAPESYGGYTATDFRAEGREMIEIIYRDGSGKEGFRIRKATGTDDVSGDYNDYSEDRSIEAKDGTTLRLRGDGGKVSVITWTDGTYSFAIDAEDQPFASADEAKTLAEQVIG